MEERFDWTKDYIYWDMCEKAAPLLPAVGAERDGIWAMSLGETEDDDVPAYPIYSPTELMSMYMRETRSLCWDGENWIKE